MSDTREAASQAVLAALEAIRLGHVGRAEDILKEYCANAHNKAEVENHKHIARVRQLLGEFAIEMIRRGDIHDQSKFEPVELEPLQRLQEITDREGPAPFGTEEYSRRTELLGPMIEHHRANNSHHPEYYSDGVAGMDLFDLVEMFFDWKAASERGQEPAMNLHFAIQKYEIEPQLASILLNTAKRLGYSVKDPE